MSVSVLDLIVDALNTVEGLEVRKDAWVEATEGDGVPGTYGVLTLEKEMLLWADDKPSFQQLTMRLECWCEQGVEEDFLNAVEAALGTVGDVLDLTWNLNAREYDFEIDNTHYTWAITRYGGLTVESGDTDET